MICKLSFTLIVVVAAVAADPINPSKEIEKQFEEFLDKHEKRYDEAEYEKRLQIFAKNAQRVAELNAHEAGTAQYSLSGPFADWEPREFVEYELVEEGTLFEQRQQRNRQLRGLRGLSAECPRCTESYIPTLDTSNLPTNFDWRARGAVNPVQKQKCNDCWAFAGTAALEGAWVVQAGEPLAKFSEQQAIDCSPGTCHQGGRSFRFWREMVNTDNGLSTLADYPYRNQCDGCHAKSTAHGCSSTKSGPKVKDFKKIGWTWGIDTEDQIAAAVVKYGPILTGIDARGLQFFSGKVTRPKMKGTDATCTTGENHAVVLVGFGVEDGVKYWLIRNSWGTTWGDDGYLKMERGIGACGLHLNPEIPIMEPPTYVKSGGGRRAVCPVGDQVDSVEECKRAGGSLGFPFWKSVTTTGDRPGGCFWDQNGFSYFNTNLKSTATWGGVGAICRGIFEKAETCSTDLMIKTAAECEIAGRTVGYTFNPTPDFESRPPHGKCTYNDNLPGAALRRNPHTVIMSLAFGQLFNKRQWIFNLGQKTTGAQHWLWKNGDNIQFGMWDGAQIWRGDISNARTLATVFDGRNYRLYIDGQAVATKTISLDILSGAMAVGIGKDDDFKGCIYGVNVYRSALSDEQVQAAAKTLPNPNMPLGGDVVSGPGGCFWNQDGYSYFNQDLEATLDSTVTSVGGICRALRTEITASSVSR